MKRFFPAYPEFREIRFEDKEALDAVFKAYPPRISEYTFTNLFVWRETSRTFLSQIEDTVLVKRGKLETEQLLLLPPVGGGDISETVSKILAITNREEELPSIYGLDAIQAEALSREGFAVKAVRDQWDYVYRVKDLAELPGEKYYVKRKNIKKCVAEYSPEYRPLTADLIEQCLRMQRNWCNLRDCDAVPGLEAENKAVKEALLHFGDLEVFGGAVLIRGEVEAFTVGGWLNADTAVIHFEKANPSIGGLYQVINQVLILIYW